MARYAPAALVAALLVATALAFAYTESLKLTPSPIIRTHVTKVFSPVCDCDTGTASIAFSLRSADRVEIDIVHGGDVKRHLVAGRAYPKGTLEVVWDGRDDAGNVVPQGAYKPRVKLARQRRTIVLPNVIRVDTVAPTVELTRLAPRVFSPDGDRRADRVVVGYRVSEPARVSLWVDGRRAVLKKGQKTKGTIDWFGSVDGSPLSQGSYRLEVEAVDVAGNVGARTESKPVVVRYVALGRKRIEVVVGARIAVLVLTDAAQIEWKLGSRTGSARPGTLQLQAPLQTGRFTLTVTANGHSARAAVIVRSAGT